MSEIEEIIPETKTPTIQVADHVLTICKDFGPCAAGDVRLFWKDGFWCFQRWNDFKEKDGAWETMSEFDGQAGINFDGE